MFPVLVLFVVAAFALFFGVSLRRAQELFVVDVRATAVTLKRGRIPPPLLQDLRDVFEGGHCQGTLRVIARQGSPVLLAKGAFPADTLQRVRNLIGLYSLAKLRAGATRGR